MQDSYVESIINKEKIPLTALPALALTKNQGRAIAREVKRYQQRVGKLNYAAVITRPDIAFRVSKLSEFLQNSSKQHMKAVEHMIKYLGGTKYRGMVYSGNPQYISCQSFIASSDASFADDPETRYSSSGFCLQLFNGMIHWKATKQK